MGNIMKVFIGVLILTFSLFPVCTGGDGWAQTLARMNVGIVGGSVPAAGGGGGPDAWYDLAAFSSGSSWWNNTTSAIASISVTTGGTATKLRAYVYDEDGGTAFKIALYNADGSSLLGSCTVATVTTGAWNECTLSSGVAVTSATRYRVAVLSNANLNWGKGSGNSAYGFYAGGQTYSSFPPATMTSTDAADEDHCFGIYVD